MVKYNSGLISVPEILDILNKYHLGTFSDIFSKSSNRFFFCVLGASQQEGTSTSNEENESNFRYRLTIFYIIIQAILLFVAIGVGFADSDWHIWLIVGQIAIGIWPLLKSCYIAFLRFVFIKFEKEIKTVTVFLQNFEPMY